VIPANDKGPRPPLPYLTLRLTAADLVEGTDEDLPALGDDVTVTDAGAEGTDYVLTVNGEVVTYTRTAAATTVALVAADLADAILDAVDDVFAEADGAVVTISARTGTLATSTVDARLSLAEDETPVVGTGGIRSASLSVQGFGEEAAAWLERATLRLRTPAVRTLLDAAGLSVVASGGMTDLATFLDTSIEARVLREYVIAYAVRTDPVTVTPAETAAVALTLDRELGAPDALDITTTAELA
jgi:hypothetical protein